jgi:hypothetical protein
MCTNLFIVLSLITLCSKRRFTVLSSDLNTSRELEGDPDIDGENPTSLVHDPSEETT